MGCYLFHQASVFFVGDSGLETLPFADLERSPMVRDTRAHLLIIDGEGPAFFGQVARIREIFPPGGIRTFVPYTLALYAALEGLGLMAPAGRMIVADDAGEKFFITLFNGVRAVVMRVVPANDPATVAAEIRRTVKSADDSATSGPPGLITNNAAVAAVIDADGDMAVELFERPMPAFEALGKVKFPVQLMSPAEAALRQRRMIARQMLAACLAAALVAAGGWGFAIRAMAREKAAGEALAAAQQTAGALRAGIKDLAAATCAARRRTLPAVSFPSIAAAFLGQVPPQARIESLGFERGQGLRWQFTGSLYFPGQEIVPWVDDGSMGLAHVKDVVIQHRPGFVVTVFVPEGGT